MAKAVMLTTIDNPFDPFTQFLDWLQFDNVNNYKCCELVARFARTSDAFSETENNKEIEDAIDRIIENDFLNIYKKVYENEFKFDYNDKELSKSED